MEALARLVHLLLLLLGCKEHIWKALNLRSLELNRAELAWSLLMAELEGSKLLSHVVLHRPLPQLLLVVRLGRRRHVLLFIHLILMGRVLLWVVLGLGHGGRMLLKLS